MSTPEALLEYSQEHSGDIDTIVQRLRAKDNPPIAEAEIDDVISKLNLESTAFYKGSCFSITRDFTNHYYLTEDQESRRAA